MTPAPLRPFLKKNQLRLHSYLRNSLRFRPESTPTLCLLHTSAVFCCIRLHWNA